MSDAMQYGFAFAAALAGLAAGWLHFRSLQALSARIVAGEKRAIVLQLARLVMLGLFLFLCTRGGALVLLAGALGVFAGRALVLRAVTKGEP